MTGPVCVGGSPLTGENLTSLAGDYESRIHNPVCYMSSSDTGWTSYVPAVSGWCGEAYQEEVDGVMESQPRSLYYSGSSDNGSGCPGTPFEEYLRATRYRAIGCAPGFVMREHATREYVCVKAPPCEKCLGNPVDPHRGAKMLREADFNFGAAGGPSFERFYNSQGYYSRTSRDPVAGDFWRHSYAAEIVPIADINGIMAAARRPDSCMTQP